MNTLPYAAAFRPRSFTVRPAWRRAAAALLLAVGGVAAQAQILIGQTTAVTGPVAASVGETLVGVRLYLDHVNARGGVHGEQIRLITLDDKFEPKLAGENARQLIEEHKVAALFMSRATPHTQAILPHLAKHQIALIAPSTGAMVLHQPVRKHVFNVRATYQREAEKAMTHLATLGMNRIAVLYADDSFGADGYAALRKAGSTAQLVTLSNNASSGFIKSLGEQARGVIVSQVFPNERSLAYPLVKEALELSKAGGQGDISPAMLEGFAAAKVLVEGLRRAGPKPTREKIQAALEAIQQYDLGGLPISYGQKDHTGLDFADLSIIGADGKFRR